MPVPGTSSEVGVYFLVPGEDARELKESVTAKFISWPTSVGGVFAAFCFLTLVPAVGDTIGRLLAAAILGVSLLTSLRILLEYERGVVFRLGRLLPTPIGPGLSFILFPFDRMVRISLRTITLDVPPQDVITKDNVSVKVNAVVYFRVVDQQKAIIEVEDYIYATSMMSQTTLRSVLGQSNLDDLLSKRDEINSELQRIIDTQTEPWGIKVSAVEVKNVDLPQEMQRAIAKQAEAERERRSKVIHAEGEFQAAQRLYEAANVMSQNPISLQLRYLQTLVEVAGDRSSTTIFPIPIDIITPLLKSLEKK
ncbi:MAG: slipin family protein [Nitrospirae bacterium]|nr:slipin family protein [Nitrospirota bacterium]